MRLSYAVKLRKRQLSEQAGELVARLREWEAERGASKVTGKTLRAMAADLQLEGPPTPVLPDCAAYQQITCVCAFGRCMGRRRPRLSCVGSIAGSFRRCRPRG
jgi:hypothetical protein